MKRAALGVLLCGLAVSGYAENLSGVGLQYGRSSAGQGLKDPSYKGVGRIQFSPNFGAEFASIDQAAGLNGTEVPTSRGFAGKGTSLFGIGTLPLSESVSVFGKLGLVRGEDEKLLVFGGPAYALENGTDLTYGVGLKYDFSPNLGLRFEWQRFTPGGYLQNSSEGDVDLLSGGLRYRF